MKKKKQGLWANIHAKKKRGEKMRKKGAKGAPTAAAMASAQRKKQCLLLEINNILLGDKYADV